MSEPPRPGPRPGPPAGLRPAQDAPADPSTDPHAGPQTGPDAGDEGTGDARVDQALAGVADLEDLGVDEHAERLSAAHTALQEVLRQPTDR